MTRDEYVEAKFSNPLRPKRITREEISHYVDARRADILEAMKTRTCPTSAEAITRIMGGTYWEDANGHVKVAPVISRAFSELVEEGRLARQQTPDGSDPYYIPGGPSDPALTQQVGRFQRKPPPGRRIVPRENGIEVISPDGDHCIAKLLAIAPMHRPVNMFFRLAQAMLQPPGDE